MKKIYRHLLVFVLAALYYDFLQLTDMTCLFRGITGIPCPACGTTRSLISLLRLDFSKSFYYHPVGFLLLWTVFLAFHKDIFLKYVRQAFFWFCFYGNLVIILAVYIIRMLYTVIP